MFFFGKKKKEKKQEIIKTGKNQTKSEILLFKKDIA